MFKNVTVNIVLSLLLLASGCEPTDSAPTLTGCDNLLDYCPARVHIIGLTGITRDSYGRGGKIKAYVDLLDSAGSRIKSPGTFRFELYEYVPRSSRPAGKGLLVWPDINLSDPDKNNAYWRDYLRAYQFELDLESQTAADDTFILQVTYYSPTAKRLSDSFQLKYKK